MAINGVVACLEAVRQAARAQRQGGRTLHVERLEDRRLMDADAIVAGTAADPGGAPMVATPKFSLAATGADADALVDARLGAPRPASHAVGLAAAIHQLAEARVFGAKLAPRLSK
jgi:hypothetical protein